MKHEASQKRLLLRGYQEIKKMSPHMLSRSVVSAIVTATHPFVNIFFSSQIIAQLSSKQPSASKLLWLISIAGVLNMFLFFIKELLTEHLDYLRQSLLFEEINKINKVLFRMEYKYLADSAFQDKVRLYKECSHQTGNPVFMVGFLTRDWVQGAVTIVWSAVFILPAIRLGFVRTGPGFVESPWFMLLLCGCVALASLLVLWISRRLNGKGAALQNQFIQIHRLFGYYMDKISDYTTGQEIRIYQAQPLIVQHATKNLLTQGRKIQTKLSATIQRADAALAVIGAAVGCGIYLFLGLKGRVGLFSTGNLVLYIGGFFQIIQGILALSNSIGQIAAVAPTLGYYFDVLQVDKADSSQTGGMAPPAAEAHQLELCSVSFRYPGASDYALKEVSMTLKEGERLAIVGENGSGKTTLIQLLCRLYETQEGRIFYNGMDIKMFDLRLYRALFSVVFQDFKIFSFSLGGNVACDEHYDRDRVLQMLGQARFQLHPEKMTKGLGTYLYKDCDQNGVEISGGEAQKIALARALYVSSAPFIILDEPTAALDPIAESELYQHFNTMTKGKTAIYISHRLSSCLFCDKIAVLDKGRLVQYGTHAQLIQETGKKYYELWNAQARYYEDAVSMRGTEQEMQ